jgi:hypothetical protein
VPATSQPTVEPSAEPLATATPDTAVTSRLDGLQGQNGTYCKAGTRFAIRILGASETRADTIALVIEAINLGSHSEDISRMVDLRDDRGRTFDMASASEYQRYYDELRPLRASGVISSVTNIQPGRTERVYTVFLVAPDSASFRVTQRRPPCA